MSGKPRPVVFLSRGIIPSGLARLRERCEVIKWEENGYIPHEVFVERVRRYKPDAIFVQAPDQVDRRLLDAAGGNLKVVGTLSVGVEHIDLEECRRRGIAVGHTPTPTLAVAVAEYTIGLVLAVARNFKPGIDSVNNGVWGTRWNNGLWMAGKEIGGSVVGIVGLGRIGLAVASRLKGFNPSKILYSGTNPKVDAKQVGAEFVTFDDLLYQSDYVIATCSINESNKGLFNRFTFDKMNKTAIFVNVSRGLLVNQVDLYDTLVNGDIAGAALDVTSPEPLPTHHRLLKLDNCIITPHIAGATERTRLTMCDMTVDNILAGLQGQPLPFSAL